MDFIDYFASVGPSLLFSSPMLAAWIVGIVIAARMLKAGGGKAERLLLVGCCLMLAERLISPFSTVLVLWLVNRQEMEAQGFGLIISIVNIPLSLISLVGIVCLVYAFWIRFKSHRQQSRDHSPQAVAD